MRYSESMKASVPNSSKQPTSRMLVFLQGVFLVMFLVFGTGILRAGIRAIRDRTYTLNYTESLGLGYTGHGTTWTSDKAVEFQDHFRCKEKT